MRTQLFNIREDPAQLHDQAHTHPQVVGRLMQSAADFLGAASAPIDQFERLGLPKPKVSAYAAAH
jgi:hypothetical protein